MPGFSDYLEQKILEWLFKRGTFPTVNNNVFVSLHFGDPEGAGGSELQTVGTGSQGFSPAYARVSVTTDAAPGTNTHWSALGAGSPSTAQLVSNQDTAGIAFLTATGDWNQPNGGGAARAILYFGIFDALTVGNFLGGGQITPAGTGVVIASGQQLSFGQNQLTFQVD